MYRASKIRRHRRWEGVVSGPFALFFFAASFARTAEGIPIDKVNVRKTANTYVASITVGAALGAGAVAGFVCEPIVGALVLPMGATVNIDNVTQDLSTAVLDADYYNNESDEYGLLAKALYNDERELYDFVQPLFTFRFHPNWPCPRPTVVEVTFGVETGQGVPVDLVRFTGGATNESDINDGSPLTNFQIVDVPIVVIPIPTVVPTVSEWGLLIMTLVLLAGLTIQFARLGRRQKPSSLRS